MFKKRQIAVVLLLAVMLLTGITAKRSFAASVPETPVLKTAVSKSYNSVKITWKKVSKADGYYVYRKESGESWKRIATVKSGSTAAYTDKGLTCGTKYTYTVKAYWVKNKEKIAGGYSKAGITCKPVPATPDLKSADSISDVSIKLVWGKVDGADGYYVYRKTSDSSWKRIKEVKNSTSLKDTNLTCGTDYIYTVKAYRIVKNKKITGGYSKTGISRKPVPAAPVLKSAKAQSYDTIQLTWEKVTRADGYYVYRKQSGESWQRIKTVSSGSTAAYTDTGLKSGKTYIYTVKAYRTVNGENVAGLYDKTGLSAKTKALEQTQISLAVNSDTRVQIEWKRCSDADGYQVWRSTIKDSGYTLVGSTKELEYLDTSLVKGMTYYYRVRAYKKIDSSTAYGKWSDVKKISLPSMYNSKKVITPLENGINIYTAGDSTVKNYAENGVSQKGKTASKGSWGESLQNFFDSEVIQVNDYAISGLSSRGFINHGWLKKIRSTIQEGDYLFIQFGHNDQHANKQEQYTMLGEPDENGIYPVIAGKKTQTPDDLKDTYGETWYAQDSGTYKWYLYQYVDTALDAGAVPVLVTPVARILFNSNGTIRKQHDSTDVEASERKDAYVTAMKQVYDEYRAKGEMIYLIDMYSITKKLYEEAYQADDDASGKISPLVKQLFDTDDTTHSSKLGGFILSAGMALEIKRSELGIADQVKQPKNVTSAADDNETAVVIVDHKSGFTGYALTVSDGTYTAKKSSYWIAIGKELISKLQ